MAAKSNKYGDVYKWIESIINSCKYPEQELMIRRLIILYHQKYRVKNPGFDTIKHDLDFEESLILQVKELNKLANAKFKEISVS